MIDRHFTATNKWYELAALGETNIPDISAGPSDFFISELIGNNATLKKIP